MKIINYLLVLVLLLTSIVCMARNEENLNLHFPGRDHYNVPIPADMPDVYYNNDMRTLTIDGGGEVNYYDIEIISWTTLNTVISTQVNGYYDTIDVSSLPDGEYNIIIYSPTGYTFDGDFAIY